MSQTETSFLSERRRNPRFMLLSVLLTAVVIGAFFYESHVGFGTRPQHLIYVASWPSSRSAADAVREQNVRESARQAAIAQFEIERGQALLSRAETPQARAAAQAHIAQSRAALAKWNAEHAVAQAVLDANPAPTITKPVAATAPSAASPHGPA